MSKHTTLQKQALHASLVGELRSKYTKRSVRVRKGDTVKVLRGEYSGVEAKVTAVHPRSGRLSVEGVTREKIAGGTVPIQIHASKVMITALNLDDPWRKKALEAKEGE
jgi:large subunit ribosomal protein L24